jgi:hypothetical protein
VRQVRPASEELIDLARAGHVEPASHAPPSLGDEAEAYAVTLTAPDGNQVVALALGYTGALDEGKDPRAR